MTQFCEMMMLVCFGISWPLNLLKSIRARTAKGKSLLFEVFVFVGYLFGMSGKFIGGNVSYVVILYIINALMVGADILVTLRNRRLDRVSMEGEKA